MIMVHIKYPFLYFRLYISSCTIVLGFEFIFRFKSKSKFDGTEIELDNGSVITDQKTSCTSIPKGNLQNKKIK